MSIGKILKHTYLILLQVVNNQGKVHNICDLVREHEEATMVQKEETLLMKLLFNDLQFLVRAVNNGRGTRSKADGQELLIKYVKKNCVCLKQY